MIECHSNPKVALVSWAPSLALHHLEVNLGVGSVLRQMCEQAVGRQDQMGSQHPSVSSLNALMDGERSQNELDMAEWWVGKESVRVQALTLERLKHYPSSSWDALLLHGYQQLYLTKFSPFLGCFIFEGWGKEPESLNSNSAEWNFLKSELGSKFTIPELLFTSLHS